MRYLVAILWLVLALYGANIYTESHGIPKDIYYAITVYPTIAFGMFLIIYIFGKFKKNKK